MIETFLYFPVLDFLQRETRSFDDLYPSVESSIVVACHDQTIKESLLKPCQLIYFFALANALLQNSVWHFKILFH